MDNISPPPRVASVVWTDKLDEYLREGILKHTGLEHLEIKETTWHDVAQHVNALTYVKTKARLGTKSPHECQERWMDIRDSVKARGRWSVLEDKRLREAVVTHGTKSWVQIAQCIPGRNCKQSRERYCNHVNPTIRRSDWTLVEDDLLLQKQALLGNKWTDISRFLPGRSETSIKNRFKSVVNRFNTAVVVVEEEEGAEAEADTGILLADVGMRTTLNRSRSMVDVLLEYEP